MKKTMVILLLLLMIPISPLAFGAESSNNSVVPPDNSVNFAKIYVDGASADSNGFKLLLRASERHAGVHYQPYIVDINFILMDGNKVICSDTVRQIPVGEGIDGSAEISHLWYVTLEDGKKYKALAEVYLYEKGKADYLTWTSASFTAITDATITDIYADSIGASATVKGKSMVPLDAKIIFTLKQESKVLDIKEIEAPFIMSNEKEKTVDVLWNKSLPAGRYVISSELQGKEIIARYDKAITIEKPKISETTTTPKPATPGFQAYIALGAMVAVILVLKGIK